MEREEVFNKVQEAVADLMNKDVAEITEATTFEELAADSLDLIELISDMEDTFDTTIEDEDLKSITSVDDAVDAILTALNK